MTTVVSVQVVPARILAAVRRKVRIGQIAGALKPAGLEASKDIVSDFYLKDPNDPQWHDDAGYKGWLAFMNKWYPSGDKNDVNNVFGPSAAATIVRVLEACGDELTRENVMKQAANLDHLELPMLLPGITVNTTPTDFAPVKQVQMGRFNGERWELFGPILTGAIG